MCYDYDIQTIEARTKLETIHPIQNIDINELYFETVFKYIKNGQSILDIGTGNGYILKTIVQKSTNQELELYGVDNSEEMVSLARNNLSEQAIIIKADANHLPFSDRRFDLITAKNVTRINAKEIYRVLKPGGFFVFREYGTNKGLCEIASLFPGRIIRQRDPSFYANNLEKAGLTIVSLDSYRVVRKYTSIEELIVIINSFPFIENFSQADEQTIIKKIHDPVVTSDPFILVCRKEEAL